MALGIVMILEGLIYGLAPSFVLRLLESLRDTPPQILRLIAALVGVTGLALIWLAVQIA